MEHSFPLVVFTVLSQLAIGAFATLFIMDAYKKRISQKASFIMCGVILVIALVAVLASLFHLGHPLNAYRALLNIGDSWLTREIVFFPGFMLGAFIYALFAKTASSKKWIGMATVALGTITIFCTAMIYIIPAIPAWNNGTTMAAFFMTALLVGPVLIQVMLYLLKEKTMDLSKYTMIMAAFVIVLNVLNVTILSGGIAEAAQTGALLLESPLFWIKMILLAAGLGLAGYMIINRKMKSMGMVSVLFICFFGAEFIGRILFYSTGIHL
ncbi:dimethyl sulfoxide reductase anchor subunit family protein [Bacillus sp. 1P06AnD]|uniref:dimethyl sulfoxide reductase anchor subunit family protein n=1 Tax=Bacillus sp. 1P06AnD TaxID=3132208 RepID=UPI0039A137AF